MQTGNFSKSDLKEAYDLYFEPLRRFLYFKSGEIALAEDLVQEVFIKLWQKRDTVKKDTVKNLLYTMATNLWINHINHQQVVSKHQDETKAVLADTTTPCPQFQLEEKEFEFKLNACLAAMTPGCREVFLLNRIEKKRYEEIAGLLNIGIKAVEKRMSAALKVIREQLGRKI